MDSQKKSFSLNIPNYSGPLDVLLDLAKSQKVDLSDISVTTSRGSILTFH